MRQTVSRVDLVAILLGGQLSESTSATFSRPHGRGDVTVLWAREGEQRPQRSDWPLAVIVPESEIRDFLAWMTAHFPTAVPLTSMLRIMSDREEKIYSQLHGISFDNKLASCALGLAVAGVMSSNLRVRSGGAHESFSSAAYKLFRLGAPAIELKRLRDHWIEAHELLARAADLEEVGASYAVWKITFLFAGLGSKGLTAKEISSEYASLASAILVEGNISKEICEEISFVSGLKNPLYLDPSRTQEERFGLLERLAFELTTAPREDVGFLLGLAAAQLGRGSLQYLPVVHRLTKFPADMAAWLGFFAGIYGRPELRQSGGGIGLRIISDVVLDPFRNPLGDIAFCEFAAIGDQLDSIWNRAGSRRSTVNVELLPGIIVEFSEHEFRTSTLDPTQSVAADELRVLIDQVYHSLHRLRARVEHSSGGKPPARETPRRPGHQGELPIRRPNSRRDQ
jgi:hypothetical protein